MSSSEIWYTILSSSGSYSSGTLALTLQHDYDISLTDPTISGGLAFATRTRTTTTMPGPAGNLVKKTEATYDAFQYTYNGTNYWGRRGNVMDSKEYAFGAGAAGGLARQQVFSYLHDSNSNYIPKNIINRVLNVQTKNAAGTKVAEAFTFYDTTSLTSMTGVTHHDDTNFGTGYTLRGNPTMTAVWTGSGSSCDDKGYLCSYLNYDTTGQAIQAVDLKGNATQFSYTDNFSSSGCSYSGNTYHAYVTQVTLPVSGTLRNCYYHGSGNVYTAKDQNDQATTRLYEDPLDRPTNTTLAGGGWAETDYTSATQRDYTASVTASAIRWDWSNLDWQNRTLEKRLKSDPQGETIEKTTYDTSGRVQSVTNPYRSTQDPTYGSTSYQYDGLNRVTQTTLPDGNTVEGFYGSAVGAGGGRTTQLCASGTYGLGYPVLSKDEAGKKRQVWTDALGRLIEADEPDSSGDLTLGTCYQYDTLGNLKEVNQGVQTRTLSYDALSRLTSETTPEASTVNYYYTTATGALCAGNAKALCRATDARGITATYTYDALNRLTGKTYSNGDAAVSYYYDQTSYNGLTITNGKGWRTGMSDGSGQTAWSYNVDGRVVKERRTIAGITKEISYAYYFGGAYSSITYPSGMVVYSYPQAAGRLFRISYGPGSPASLDFVHDATYAPQGALASLVAGWVNGGFAGITSTYTYNNRLQPDNATTTPAGGAAVLNHTYNFVSGGINDGQVKSIANNLTTGRGQTYTYDEMNRLKTAKTQATTGSVCWGQEYTYDRYANLPTITIPSSHASCTQPVLNLGISQTTNRITDSGYTYDNAGNLLTDGFGGTFTWNAEGRMVTTAGVGYIYDGDGRRVAKTSGKRYWYGLNGEVLAESDGGTITAEYIYFNGARIARRDPATGNVYYFLADRLGSARVITDANGVVQEESDFLPYGTERVITDNLDNTYKFTGHERDAESGLDHTFYRKQSISLGRWLSPDPVHGKPVNPQTWNRYAYTAGDPVNRTDPSGAFPCINPNDLFCMEYDPFFDPYDVDGGSVCYIAGFIIGRMPGMSCAQSWEYLQALRAGTAQPQPPPPTPPPAQPPVLFTLVAGDLNPPIISFSGFVPILPLPFLRGLFIGYVAVSTVLPDGTVCTGQGFGVGSPSAGASSGPLIYGGTENALQIVQGVSISVTLQPTPGMGVQAIANSSGALGGPTAGTPDPYGVLSVTYSNCVPPSK